MDWEVEAQEEYLATVRSGQEPISDEYTDLVDEWIKIRKAQQDEKNNTKKSINNLLKESEIAKTNKHNLLLSRCTKRKRQKSSSLDTILTVSDAEDLLATQELT